MTFLTHRNDDDDHATRCDRMSAGGRKVNSCKQDDCDKECASPEVGGPSLSLRFRPAFAFVALPPRPICCSCRIPVSKVRGDNPPDVNNPQHAHELSALVFSLLCHVRHATLFLSCPLLPIPPQNPDCVHFKYHLSANKKRFPILHPCLNTEPAAVLNSLGGLFACLISRRATAFA